MFNDLLISWYDISYICVISYLDSDASYFHCIMRHIWIYHHTKTGDGLIDCP